jgi:hypothetical protein
MLITYSCVARAQRAHGLTRHSVNANNLGKFPTQKAQTNDLDQLNTPAGCQYPKWQGKIPVMKQEAARVCLTSERE